ncbi:aldo/keto reductase [Actinoplanes sp. NPDC051494]|uniref:aldo/keto reductase n=1 Tax=Actinoplanes sp. NPDC051494 TaxID=3363907 RepID=UPI00379F0B7E
MTIASLPLGGPRDMPLLGFGTWQIQGDAAYDAVSEALRAGYRHLDTATVYGNEAEVGRAIADSGVSRDEIFITTKMPASQPGHERSTLDASLKALGVDAVDLWLIHWPPPAGTSVPMWRALLEARDQGRVHAVGVSNYDLALIDELIAETGQKPAVNQITWGPTLWDAELVAAHRERGIVVEGYSGFRNTDLGDPVLTAIGAAHGVDAARVVLRWHVQHEIVVIPKSVTPERIRNNFDIDGFTLTDDEMGRIDALSK